MSSKIFIVCLFRGGQKHMKTEACFITARARARAPATCAPLFILFPAMRALAALRIINGEGARAAVRGAAREAVRVLNRLMNMGSCDFSVEGGGGRRRGDIETEREEGGGGG